MKGVSVNVCSTLQDKSPSVKVADLTAVIFGRSWKHSWNSTSVHLPRSALQLFMPLTNAPLAILSVSRGHHNLKSDNARPGSFVVQYWRSNHPI